MLSDPSILKLHAQTIKAMTTAGGVEVAGELSAVAKEEIEF
jgi:hypothetical protein